MTPTGPSAPPGMSRLVPQATAASARHPDLLTWAEAAAILGCSRTTLKRIKAAGEIAFIPVGSGSRPRVYFTARGIEEYLEAKRVAPRRRA